uniref:Cohesin subunit SA n=1 Tax=Tetraodon nigroviridis TaxID=99883 RepID=H3C8Q5_TETNG
EAVTLFEVVSMGGSAMQMVIGDWMEAYALDRDMALLDLINFFIQCCGCRGSVVTAELCRNKKEEGDDIMSKMVEDLDEDGVEYPLAQSGSHGRWFHSDFSDFMSTLVAQCQHSVLFDSYMMNALMSLLAELSDSHIRAFRHTCTLAALKLVSALVGVALSLQVGVENSHKLYDVQKTKTTRQKSPLHLEKIQRKITELQEKRAEIESMMDILFKGIFLKRYRDVLPEVRSICMEELGLWMKLYSSAFLNDGYLKYLGWLMYDKVPDVRLKCVLSLQRLYGDPLLLPKLDLFTSRFKDRMMSMTLDKDNEVALQTMKLLILISKSADDVLSPEDYKQLFGFVYSSQRPLAAAAGELVFSRVLSTGPGSTGTQDERNDEETCKRQTYARLKALLQFYQESELHKHVVYLVDSLWDCGGALLKDWPAFTSALLQDPFHSSAFAGLTQAQQATLVEVLVASVRQASEGPVLAGRTGAKKVMSTRERKLQADDCAKLTRHLLVALPKLLSKFSTCCDVVASLMRIPQYFLPECIDAENAQAVSSLVAEMAAALELHSSSAVLEAAARSFLSLSAEGPAWCSVAQATRDALVQRWVDHLRPLLEDSLVDNCFSADEEKTGEILATDKLFVCVFGSCHDLRRWRLFELLSPLLSLESSRREPPPEVLLEVLRCLSHSILWSLSTSREGPSPPERCAGQRLQLRWFCERAHRRLSHADLSVRQQAFLGICDVLTAHSHQRRVCGRASLSAGLYTPSPRLQRTLLAFVCLHVFVGADCCSAGARSEAERLEDLHVRRNVLAAYCKLIVHGVLEMALAAEVFTHYPQHYNDFGDIIKETISRSRQVDQTESAAALVLCLQQLFARLKREQGGGGGAGHGVQTFTGIRELARRLALTFGDPVRLREGVVLIHWNGIEFVFQEFSQTAETPAPPYLAYLAILSEFSCKLLKPDKKTVFSYLQKHTAGCSVDLRKECWQPLAYYRSSLLAVAEGEDAASCSSSDKRPLMATRPSSKQKP